MSNKKRFVGALVLSSLMYASGCATTKAQLPPQTATSLVDLRHSLASGKVHIGRTSSALRDLADNPRSNTVRQVGLVGKEMAELESETQRIRDINMRMQAKSAEHYSSWSAELESVKNPKIAAAGRKRKEQTRATMDAIRAKLDEAEEVLSPYMSDLVDINRYLQQDPTAEGVTSLVPIIRECLSRQTQTVRQLDGVITHIDRVTRSVE